jgi:hypothetical protein
VEFSQYLANVLTQVLNKDIIYVPGCERQKVIEYLQTRPVIIDVVNYFQYPRHITVAYEVEEDMIRVRKGVFESAWVAVTSVLRDFNPIIVEVI